MATRPVFVPQIDEKIGVTEKLIDFKWHPGMAKSQKQKSIQELHNASKSLGLNRILEISSKSLDDLGVSLSAFNLSFTTQKYNITMTVESAFQGSKVFKKGGPYNDLYLTDSLSAKRDLRLKDSGQLISFRFCGAEFPLIPRTYFYDWLYINALYKNNEITEKLFEFDGFSDIEFNPAKSINCQANSVALFISLVNANKLHEALECPKSFLSVTREHYEKNKPDIQIQDSLI